MELYSKRPFRSARIPVGDGVKSRLSKVVAALKHHAKAQEAENRDGNSDCNLVVWEENESRRTCYFHSVSMGDWFDYDKLDSFEIESQRDFDQDELEFLLSDVNSILCISKAIHFSWRIRECEQLMEIRVYPETGRQSGSLVFHTGFGFENEWAPTKERLELYTAIHQALHPNLIVAPDYNEIHLKFQTPDHIQALKTILDTGNKILGITPNVIVRYQIGCDQFQNKSRFPFNQDVLHICEYSMKYRRKFDLFARPKEPFEGIRAHSYAHAQRYGLTDFVEVPLLAINVVHTSADSWVELQSARGAAWIEEAATILQQPVEIWEGPQEERWGWYRTPSPGNHVRVFDPSIHKAEVPVYDID